MISASRFYLFTIAFMSTGCAMKHAQNAQEFRQMAPDNMYGEHKTFEINNSYSRAVNGIKSRAAKCLNTAVVVTSMTKHGGKLGEQTLTYTPTVVVGKTKSELSVQQNVSGDGMILGEVPEKGMYILLADLSSSGATKSKLDIYRITYRGTDEMVSAIKNWASGQSMDCPDLTK